MKFYAVIACVLWLCTGTAGQTVGGNDAVKDTANVNKLCKLSEKFRDSDPDLSLKYADQALQAAEKIGYKKGLIDAYNQLGIVNGLLGKLPLALECFNKTIVLRNQIGDSLNNHKAYNNIGLIYKIQGENNKAIRMLKKSLNLRKYLNDSALIATSYNNLATVMMNLEQYSDALDNLYNALRIHEKTGNRSGISDACNNIGVILSRQQKYSQALQYLFRSISIDKEENNKRNLAVSYLCVGRIFREQKHYDRALEYDFLALNIQKKIKDEKRSGETLMEIGELLMSQHDYDRAWKYLQLAAEIFIQYGIKINQAQVLNDMASIENDREHPQFALKYASEAYELALTLKAIPVMQNAMLQMSTAYEKAGQFRKALSKYKIYAGLNDSVYKKQVGQKIASLENKYREAQKEKKIQLLIKDRELKDIQLKKNQTLGYFLAGGLGIVFILALFIFRAYSLKKRANKLLSESNLEVLAQKAVIEEKNKNITDSIEYAKRIQDAILPSSEEMSAYLDEFFVLFKPKSIVSGDFYWFHAFRDQVVITVADCTGHGVPGAFMSMIGNTLLNEIVIELQITSPDQILNHLREGIVHALKQRGDDDETRDGMDIALMMIDQKKMKLEFAGAHNPLYFIRDGKLREFPADKQPIGYQKEMESPFTKHVIQWKKGDVAYIFSDGYADQFGGKDERKFKTERFQELLLQICQRPMHEQHRILDDTIEKWRGETEQVDDICVFGLRL